MRDGVLDKFVSRARKVDARKTCHTSLGSERSAGFYGHGARVLRNELSASWNSDRLECPEHEYVVLCLSIIEVDVGLDAIAARGGATHLPIGWTQLAEMARGDEITARAKRILDQLEPLKI